MKHRSIKQSIVVIGVVVAILSGASVALASHQFPDVPDSHPFHDDIDFMADRQITGGFGDGTYRPNSNVTRGQMSRFMTRLADALTPTIFSTGESFSYDVSEFSGQGCLTSTWTVPDYETQVSLVATASMIADSSEPATVSMLTNVQASNDGGATGVVGFSQAGFSVAPGEESSGGVEGSFNSLDVFAPGEEVVFYVRLDDILTPTLDATSYCSLLVTIDHQMPSDDPLAPSGNQGTTSRLTD